MQPGKFSLLNAWRSYFLHDVVLTCQQEAQAMAMRTNVVESNVHCDDEDLLRLFSEATV